MSYAIAVGIYIAFYVVGVVLPLLSGDRQSIFQLIAFSIPVLLVMPRVAQRFSDGQQLVPRLFRRDGGLLYGGGNALVLIGHLAFFGSLTAVVAYTVTGTVGLPIGTVTGFALYPYLAGIVLIEIAYRQWSNRQAEQLWKRQTKLVYITVGLVVALQLGFNFTSDRPIDLLSYDEREAVALGRGYAREVQRVVDRIYVNEDRIPCVSENYFDPDSLLHSTNRDSRSMLSIELLNCGQFVVTIHPSIDGVAHGQLLYMATPGDADAGMPLVWHCISAHHERIARHTNGGCAYDPALANRLPAFAEVPAVAARATQALTTASAAPSTGQPPSGSGVSLQAHLDRLAEPTLWEDCGDDVMSYRFLKFDDNQYVAAVRISHDSQAGAFRSVTSESPNNAIGLDGYLDDTTWRRLVASVEAAGFWSLVSERESSGPDGGRLYVEGCRNGSYHAVQRSMNDPGLSQAAGLFAKVGKLEWLEN